MTALHRLLVLAAKGTDLGLQPCSPFLDSVVARLGLTQLLGRRVEVAVQRLDLRGQADAFGFELRAPLLEAGALGGALVPRMAEGLLGRREVLDLALDGAQDRFRLGALELDCVTRRQTR